MELRIITPSKHGVISDDDLDWIGATEIELHCTSCGNARTPLYEFYDYDEPFCGECLVNSWLEDAPDESEE